jgi:enamine deaminase RidA (YjgF/YER057c/UK114 family)
MQSARSIKRAAGAGRANIVKLGMYVVDLNKERLQLLRSLRDACVDKDHPPASTLVGVQALFREEYPVEIEAIAVIP